jgi:hypothetical protein
MLRLINQRLWLAGPAVLAGSSLVFGSPLLAWGQILQQQVIFDQDPWDPQSRLGVGNCVTAADGSETCDTRPKAQVWVETVGDGWN